ncbi:MAG: hypothetical protein HC822_15920 [Oscillochloris sp.]|nr:hypothetical protein [Oscillochloris sp.]
MEEEQMDVLRATVNSQPIGLALTTLLYELRRYLTVIHGNVNILRNARAETDETLEATAQYMYDLERTVDELLVKIIIPRVESMEKPPS